jgi:hypothetical protein
VTDPETPTSTPVFLPLIPLDDALVLPGMAISVDLASPEANAGKVAPIKLTNKQSANQR